MKCSKRAIVMLKIGYKNEVDIQKQFNLYCDILIVANWGHTTRIWIFLFLLPKTVVFFWRNASAWSVNVSQYFCFALGTDDAESIAASTVILTQSKDLHRFSPAKHLSSDSVGWNTMPIFNRRRKPKARVNVRLLILI